MIPGGVLSTFRWHLCVRTHLRFWHVNYKCPWVLIRNYTVVIGCMYRMGVSHELTGQKLGCVHVRVQMYVPTPYFWPVNYKCPWVLTLTNTVDNTHVHAMSDLQSHFWL